MLISFVIPVFNEEESLRELYQRIIANVEPTGHTCEIIFVDDGSSDNSLNVLKDLHSEDGRGKVIQFRRNFGKAAALMAGPGEIGSGL